MRRISGVNGGISSFMWRLATSKGCLVCPLAILCSHCYDAFPQFKVVKGDHDEQTFRYAAHMSSGHDLVEEFVACGVWPLAHDWALGEILPHRMPTLGIN